MSLDDVRQILINKTSIRCDEIGNLLKLLGFQVRDGRTGGHKVFLHPGIPTFYSGSYNCGHGKNPSIKQAYIKNIIKILDAYRSELKIYLEEDDND
jgi:hypothetical protein